MVRDFQTQDKDTVMAMVDTFYHSPAVNHDIPVSNFGDAYEEMCGGGSARVRGLYIEHEGTPAGFCSLSFGYSTEAGGPVVIIEEIYVADEFRGHGLGGEVFQFVKDEYRDKAKRLRLEVATGNTRAIALYERLGFTVLPYTQMITEDF